MSHEDITIKGCLDKARARLAPFHETASLDAELLLMHASGLTRTTLHAWPERELPESSRARFDDLVARRAAGEPIAYLVGQRDFWSFNLKVTSDTLIPRPETELLVERALALIPAQAGWRIADLGTGSGAIALAIAQERPQCHVVATDASAAALAVARENAQCLGLSRVDFRHGHWFEPLAGERFELIASNPPYVAPGDAHLRQGDLVFEPTSALVADGGGLADLGHIIEHAGAHLTADGWLLLEHGWDQGAAVATLLRQQGFDSVETLRDLAGRDRISLGRWTPAP